jgi:hypothetical protein
MKGFFNKLEKKLTQKFPDLRFSVDKCGVKLSDGRKLFNFSQVADHLKSANSDLVLNYIVDVVEKRIINLV